MEAARYGIGAVYLRTVYKGYLDPELEEIELPVATIAPEIETPIASRDVYFLELGTDVLYFAWLTHSELELLRRSSLIEEQVERWLFALRLEGSKEEEEA